MKWYNWFLISLLVLFVVFDDDVEKVGGEGIEQYKAVQVVEVTPEKIIIEEPEKSEAKKAIDETMGTWEIALQIFLICFCIWVIALILRLFRDFSRY